MDELEHFNENIRTVLKFGAQHGSFDIDTLERGTGLKREQCGMYSDLLCEKVGNQHLNESAGRRLSVAALSLHLTLIAIEDGRRSSQTAIRWSAFSISVAMLGVAVALGWKDWSVALLALPAAGAVCVDVWSRFRRAGSNAV